MSNSISISRTHPKAGSQQITAIGIQKVGWKRIFPSPCIGVGLIIGSHQIRDGLDTSTKCVECDDKDSDISVATNTWIADSGASCRIVMRI